MVDYIRLLLKQLPFTGEEDPEPVTEPSHNHYVSGENLIVDPIRLVGNHKFRTKENRGQDQTTDHRRTYAWCARKRILTYCTTCNVHLYIGTNDETDCFSNYHNARPV